MLAWITVALSLSAADAVDRTAAQRFLGNLQRAMAQGDKRAVAALSRYPIRVLAQGYDVPILNPSELVRLFDLVFPPEVRCAIAAARMEAADRPAARVTARIAGDEMSIGPGLILAQSSGAALKITRVNARQSTVVRPSHPAPRRIEFFPRAGGSREAFAGRLANDAVDSYVLSAGAGQVLDVGVQGFRGHDAALRVLDHRSGRPLAAAPPLVARTWRGMLPARGEYRIEVARQAPYCDPPFTYSLIVALR